MWLALGAALAIVRRRVAIAVWAGVTAGAAELAATLLKEAIPRARPDLPALVARPASHAFPSGHATTSFACAALLAAVEPRLRVSLYLLAALVAFSRLEAGVHWPLDVLGGAVLGLAVGAGVRALRSRATTRLRSRRVPRPG